MEGLGCQVLCSLQVWLITNYSLALCSQNDRFKTGVVMVIVKPALKTNGAWLCRMMSHTEHRFCYCRPPRAHIVKYGLNPSESVNWGTVSFAGQKGFYSVWFAVCCGRIVMIGIWAVSDHMFHKQGDFQHFLLLFFRNIIGLELLNSWCKICGVISSTDYRQPAECASSKASKWGHIWTWPAKQIEWACNKIWIWSVGQG
jgi:hypothetical protein